MRRKTLIFIVGPTAVGKTSIAVRLARRISGEIVSCDSMQIYKGMPILSQSPTARDRKAAKHHLVSVVDPGKEYSVASFRRSAAAAIKSIIKRGRIPIVTGGTGLYAKALIDGLFPSPEADVAFRRKMGRFVSRYGSARLHKRLAKTDPESASSIHPNDARRIIRALELYHSTGRTMTELKSSTKGLKEIYKIKIFGITGPREKLYSGVDARVDRMFNDGVVAEVKRLRRKPLSQTSKAALGFKEISAYLDKETDLAQAINLLKMNTRRFVKRQLTWFRADKRIIWLDSSRSSPAEIVRKIAAQAGS